MKRLIVLLIVLAGGLAAAALAIPTTAVNVDGATISQDQLSSDLSAIAHSPDYQCVLNAEQVVATNGKSSLPSVGGAGQVVGSGANPTVTTGFADSYLDTEIGHQLVVTLAAQRHLEVTAGDLKSARTALGAQIKSILAEVASSQYGCGASVNAKEVLASMPSSFVTENVRFAATVTVLERALEPVGSSATDLEGYFASHKAEFATACFTVAQYSSQSAAQAAAATVASGTPFAQVAGQVAGGGPQGCDILYGVASELPAGNLEQLPVNTVSPPIVAGSAYLLVEITSKSPTSFSAAKTEVEHAVQSAGAAKAQTLIDAAEKRSDISVDRRYGAWERATSQILAPVSPVRLDLLNASANSSVQ